MGPSNAHISGAAQMRNTEKINVGNAGTGSPDRGATTSYGELLDDHFNKVYYAGYGDYYTVHYTIGSRSGQITIEGKYVTGFNRAEITDDGLVIPKFITPHSSPKLYATMIGVLQDWALDADQWAAFGQTIGNTALLYSVVYGLIEQALARAAIGAGNYLSKSGNAGEPPGGAALERANAEQAAGRRSGTAAEVRKGDYVVTDSSTGTVRDIEPQLQKALDKAPTPRPGYHGQCGEIGCINQMLKRGVDPRGSHSTAVKIRGEANLAHGDWKEPCSTCEYVLKWFGVSW
jgi:hypothetical protein